MISYTWKTSTTLCLTRKFDRDVSSALPIRSNIDIVTSSNSSLILLAVFYWVFLIKLEGPNAKYQIGNGEVKKSGGLPGYNTIPLNVIELEGPKETLLLTAAYKKRKVCNKILKIQKQVWRVWQRQYLPQMWGCQCQSHQVGRRGSESRSRCCLANGNIINGVDDGHNDDNGGDDDNVGCCDVVVMMLVVMIVMMLMMVMIKR